MKTGLLLFVCVCLFAFSCDKQKTAVVADSDTTKAINECTQRVIHANVFLKPEKVTDFIAAAKTMIDSSNMEPGCISYELYQDPYEGTRIIFVEVWKDQAAIDAHFQMPYFLAWGPRTADWLAKPTELKIFNAAQQ